MSSPSGIPRGVESIFIHSLFRSGTTYLFEAFRRAGGMYWCYQEPLHEALLSVATTPQVLDEDPSGLAEILRHSPLSRPYFEEYKVAAADLPRFLRKELIYDHFFSTDAGHIESLRAYFELLGRHARGRPVFQECRTFARAPALVAAMGGIHLYLWRNPWDQWWSHKVVPYFDVVYLLALNAAHPPALVQALRRELQFVERHDSLEREIGYFSAHLPNAEQSYLLFYCLWCYSMLLNVTACRAEINIDSLSTSTAYRASVLESLEQIGIRGLDFSDCAVPQSVYDDKERAFFTRIERRAHQILAESGLGQAVALAEQMRASHAVSGSISPRALAACRSQVLRMTEAAAAQQRRLHDQNEELQWERGTRQRLQSQVDEITASIPWKLSAPLRWAYRSLRKAREHRS